ncbi:amidohydrolase [Namhaeicola litoreus]|uniref:Amidohydrolase n=1 Tax=Namhaeicola litoreus TaxID=1052145 RepID=A0ABW3Y4G9_9FLAO
MSITIVRSNRIFSDINDSFDSFVIEGKYIIDTGSFDHFLIKYKHAQILDLRESLILPGFNDHHIHIWKVGNLTTMMLDLRGVSSKDEMLKKIEHFSIKNRNTSWVLARGFNEINFNDKELPTAKDLDGLGINRPIFVIRSCAHIGIASTLAMKLANIDKTTVVPDGGEMRFDKNGNPNGVFCETALGLVQRHLPPYSKEEYKTMILAAQELLLYEGITSATDPAVHAELLEVYREMEQKGELKIRINAIAIRLPDGAKKAQGLPQKYNSEKLCIDTVKFFADGGLSGKTAAVSFPYKDSDTHGILRLNFEQFYALAKESIDAGLRIATHAIGDRAIELTLDVYEAIQSKPFNHRIEHLGFISSKNLSRMKNLGTVAVMQPIFVRELGANFINALSPDKLAEVYPIKTVLQNDIPVYFSTDAPVVKEINPWINIFSAMGRKTTGNQVIGENEKIGFRESILAYTHDLEYGDKNFKKGKIEKGFLADFIVYSGKTLEEVVQHGKAIRPDAVFVGGEKVI